MNFVNSSFMCQPFQRFSYFHQTVHALSARFRKTRRCTNVVCCVLEIPPSRVSPAGVLCLQGRTPVVTYCPCFERQIPQDEVLYKSRLLRAGDPTLESYPGSSVVLARADAGGYIVRLTPMELEYFACHKIYTFSNCLGCSEACTWLFVSALFFL